MWSCVYAVMCTFAEAKTCAMWGWGWQEAQGASSCKWECLFIFWNTWASWVLPTVLLALLCPSNPVFWVSGQEGRFRKSPIHFPILHLWQSQEVACPHFGRLCCLFFCAWEQVISFYHPCSTSPFPHLPTVFLADKNTSLYVSIHHPGKFLLHLHSPPSLSMSCDLYLPNINLLKAKKP